MLNGTNEQTAEMRGAPPVSDSWRRWIAENKLLRSDDRSMIDALVRNGIAEDVARSEVEAAGRHPYVDGAEWVAQRLRKLESLLAIYRSLEAQAYEPSHVERRSRVSRAEFLERYYARNKPVILTDAISSWKALADWSPGYLREHFGDRRVEIMSDRDADPRYEVESHRHKQTVWFADYIDMIERGPETNDYYLAGNNRLFDQPWAKRLVDDIQALPDYLEPVHGTAWEGHPPPAETSGKMFFWFGPAGTVTPMHHDKMNILMAQVVGRKRVTLVPSNQWPLVYNSVGVFSDVDPERPDYGAFPLFRGATVIDVVLGPGEVLFLPVGWWHHVRALDMSMTVTFTNFVFENRYEWDQPHIVRR
jgi:hypothetical protein